MYYIILYRRSIEYIVINAHQRSSTHPTNPFYMDPVGALDQVIEANGSGLMSIEVRGEVNEEA